MSRAGPTLPRLLTAGDPAHGVVRYARAVAAAVAARTGCAVQLDAVPVGTALADAGPLHVHVTDRIWGAGPEAAADRLEALCAAVALSVTLHDLPQASDGPRSFPRRAAAYRRIARAARGVAVSSAHEAALLGEIAGTDVAAAVIPLPVHAQPPLRTRPDPDEEAVVLGYFYPGKGHAEVVAAVAVLARPGLGVTVLGTASAGHDGELADLAADAARRGVRLTVTGHLGESDLLAGARRAAVPVAAHRHVSASASLNSWIAAGRRPLVPDGPYTREMETLRPHTLTRYPPGGLAAAIEGARLRPDTTWLPADATLRPDLDDVAAAYLAWWADGVAW